MGFSHWQLALCFFMEIFEEMILVLPGNPNLICLFSVLYRTTIIIVRKISRFVWNSRDMPMMCGLICRSGWFFVLICIFLHCFVWRTILNIENYNRKSNLHIFFNSINICNKWNKIILLFIIITQFHLLVFYRSKWIEINQCNVKNDFFNLKLNDLIMKCKSIIKTSSFFEDNLVLLALLRRRLPAEYKTIMDSLSIIVCP